VPYVPPCKQRVHEKRVPKQRVPQKSVMLEEGEPAKDMSSQLPTLARITDAPPIMSAPNPTTRRELRLTKRTHSWRTRNNIPGSIPLITNTAGRCHLPLPLPDILIMTAPQRSTQIYAAPMQLATTRRP
jgi:hypothetical protein